MTSLLTGDLAFYYLRVMQERINDISSQIVYLINELADMNDDVIDNLLSTDFFISVFTESRHNGNDFHTRLREELNERAAALYDLTISMWTKYNQDI